MSTTAPPPIQSTSPRIASASLDADSLIDQRIVEACRALWWAELVRSVLKLVIAVIGITGVWVAVDQWIYSPSSAVRWIVFLVLAVAGVSYVIKRVIPLLGRSIRPEYAARSLERDFPELRQSLTSYVALRKERQGSTLRHRVVRSIGASTAGHLRNHDELPTEAAGTFRWWIGTAVALALLLAYAVISPKNSFQSAARLVAPFASIQPAMRVSIQDVQPGDTEAVAGRSVAVSAKIEGLRDDEQAVLRWNRLHSNEELVLELDAETRRFIGELPLAHSDGGLILYSIEAGDGIAGPFELTVQDVPVVAIESVQYNAPKYTGQSPWTLSGGAIHALDGTHVTILATTNRPISKAKIEFNPRPRGNAVQATAGATEMEIDRVGSSLSVTFPLRSSRGRSAAVELDSYRVSVWDSAGERNPDPIIYPIRVVSDLPPEVAIVMPKKSPKDLPIGSQQMIEIHASDPDFGLQHISLEIRSGIDLIAQRVLWNDKVGAKGNQIAEYRLRPSEHRLRIGDAIQVIAIATDNRSLDHDKSVEPNTTRTDAIEFKIVASKPPPRASDPESDGVSAPDDRSASDQSQQNSGSGSQEGEQQGGGGSGGGSDGTDKQQQGESSGGEGSAGEGGESGEQQSDSNAGGSNDSGGKGESSEDQQSTAESSAQGQSNATEPSGSEGGGTESRETERSGTESTGRDPGEGEPNTGEPNDSPNESAEQQSPGNPTDDSQGGKSTPPDSGSSTGGEGSPQHDGEAFERIREYLEQKQNEEQQNEEQQNEGKQDARNQGADEKSQGPSGNQQQGNDPSENSEGGKTEQEAGDQSDSSKGAPDDSQDDDSQDDDSQDDDSQDGDSQDGGRGEQQSENANSQSGDGSSDQQGGQQGKSAPDGSGKEQDGGESKSETGEQAGSDPGKKKEANPGDSQNADGTEEANGENTNPSSDPNGKPSGGKPQSDGSEAAKSSGTKSQGDSQDAQSQAPETQTPNGQGDKSQPGDPTAAKSNSDPGIGGEGEGKGGDSELPPDEANAEYTKQATDMVLDYLKETRDLPDRELLDKLNWSEDDLRRFTDRWQKVREIAKDNRDPKTNREVDQALKSLGMKPKSKAADSNIRESADSLRAVRDSGNRRPPPAAYRDAFDKFRRASGRK